MNDFKEHDVVVAAYDIPETTIRAGDVGVVIHKYSDREMYEVEFNGVVTTVAPELLKQRMFLNHYLCPACGYEWSDMWSSTCDDECPSCGKRNVQPYESEDV